MRGMVGRRSKIFCQIGLVSELMDSLANITTCLPDFFTKEATFVVLIIVRLARRSLDFFIYFFKSKVD